MLCRRELCMLCRRELCMLCRRELCMLCIMFVLLGHRSVRWGLNGWMLTGGVLDER